MSDSPTVSITPLGGVSPSDIPPTPQPPTTSAPEGSRNPLFESQAPIIDGYQIHEPLGEGGMGTVWRATQNSTGRQVALKVLGASLLASATARARFEREVELAARLEHPNIARVYDSGIRRGLHFYAMELVSGVPLDVFVASHRFDMRKTVDLVRRVCVAVSAAHARGIMHRDLKPSNILVTPDGEPHVLDLGLAKALDTPPPQDVTQPGGICGTPLFMSPEQAAGDDRNIDIRSDVYSLGVILYKLVVGVYPHELTGSYTDFLQTVAHTPPKSAQRAKASIPRELDTVIMTALEHDLSRRYASAGDLARDLANFLEGEPLMAHPPTTLYLLGRKARKHRAAFTLAGLLAALAAAGIVFYIYSIREQQARTEEARLHAVAQRQMAEVSAFRAAEQRGLALQTVDRIVSQIQRERASGPADQARQERLMAIATGALRAMAADDRFSAADEDPAMAAALIQIGDTLMQAGLLADARDVYARAVGHLSRLSERSDAESRGSIDLVQALVNLAQAERYLGHVDAAGEDLKKARELLATLDGKPAMASLFFEPRYRVNIVGAALALDAHDLPAALESARAAVDAAQRMARATPGDAIARLLEARAQLLLGDAQAEAKNGPDALLAYGAAIEAFRALLDPARPNAVVQGGLAQALVRAAQAEFQSGANARSAQHAGEAVDAARALLALDPWSMEGNVALGLAQVRLAELAARDGDSARLTQALTQAHRQLDPLKESNSLSDPADRRRLSAALERLAALESRTPLPGAYNP